MEEDPDLSFKSYVALHAWLLRLAKLMRAQAKGAAGEEAEAALAAAQRLDPGR
jgi:hypothetical protein